MAPTVLGALIANVALLTLRAFAGSLGFIHSRKLFYLLDGMIVLVFLLFVVLIVVRFESFG
jgi:membrane protein DedA with SNARE-associated domain